MLDRHRGESGAVSNRAQLAKTGEIREARELWALGYTKYGWVCVGDNCGARMVPVAWERPNAEGWFCREDGTPFERPSHFRVEPAHKPGCNASHPGNSSNRPLPNYHIGPPSDYPHRVNLFPTQNSGRDPIKQHELEQGEEDIQRQHARWVRSIREVCEYYVYYPGQHGRPLRVDRCSGTTYGECFVRLGTGDQRSVGKNWIFYDEIRFWKWVELDVEPIRLTLLGTIHNRPRTLTIHTSGWPMEYQKEFRRRLRAALKESRAAYKAGRAERPWVFAFCSERTYDELDIEAMLQPGVDVLFCAMPRLAWRYRPTRRFVMPSPRQPPHSHPHPPPPDLDGHHVGQLGTKLEPPVTQPDSSTADLGMAASRMIADDAQMQPTPDATDASTSEEALLDDSITTDITGLDSKREISSSKGVHEPASELPEHPEVNAETPSDLIEQGPGAEVSEELFSMLPAKALLMTGSSTTVVDWTDPSHAPDDGTVGESLLRCAILEHTEPPKDTKKLILSTDEAAHDISEFANVSADKVSNSGEPDAAKQNAVDFPDITSPQSYSVSAIGKKPNQLALRRTLRRFIAAVKAWRAS